MCKTWWLQRTATQSTWPTNTSIPPWIASPIAPATILRIWQPPKFQLVWVCWYWPSLPPLSLTATPLSTYFARSSTVSFLPDCAKQCIHDSDPWPDSSRPTDPTDQIETIRSKKKACNDISPSGVSLKMELKVQPRISMRLIWKTNGKQERRVGLRISPFWVSSFCNSLLLSWPHCTVSLQTQSIWWACFNASLHHLRTYHKEGPEILYWAIRGQRTRLTCVPSLAVKNAFNAELPPTLQWHQNHRLRLTQAAANVCSFQVLMDYLRGFASFVYAWTCFSSQIPGRRRP